MRTFNQFLIEKAQPFITEGLFGFGKKQTPEEPPGIFDNHPLVQKNPRLGEMYKDLLQFLSPREAIEQFRNALTYGDQGAVFHLMKLINSSGKIKIPPRQATARPEDRNYIGDLSNYNPKLPGSSQFGGKSLDVSPENF